MMCQSEIFQPALPLAAQVPAMTHRERRPPRDSVLFWPESSPEASRNSLNVAIHGLRRTLRTVTVLPGDGTVVALRDYPDLQLWLDVEEFESRVEHGRRREEAGDAGRAAREYESADGLYRGDFLADDLYEEWAALTPIVSGSPTSTRSAASAFALQCRAVRRLRGALPADHRSIPAGNTTAGG